MSGSGAVPRRKHTHRPLRVSKTFEAASLDGPRQKQVPSKALNTLPLLPQGSQQVLTRLKKRRDKRPVKTIEFQIDPIEDSSDHSKKCSKAASLGRPRQKKVAPKATKALPLPPLGSQQVPTSRKPLRKRRDEPPVKTIQFQTYSLSGMGDDSKKANVFSSSYLQSKEIIFAACEIAEDDTESGMSSCSSSGWSCAADEQKEIIYAYCKIVEVDAESGMSSKTPTMVKTGHLPTTCASFSSASSGLRSGPLVRQGKSASAA
jgi:hypothetical protein